MTRVDLSRSLVIALLVGVPAMASLRAESEPMDFEKLQTPAFADKSFSFGPQGEKGSALFSSSNNTFNKNFDTKGADSLFSQSSTIGNKEITMPSVSNMSKSYVARTSTLPSAFTGFDNATHSIPMKSSAFGSQDAHGFNRALDMPTYTGPEANRIRKDMETIDNVLSTSKGLPNRNLTVQEVRDLLNHNAKPDKDAPAPEKK